MRKFLLGIFLMFFVLSLSSLARADTDQHCLSMCIASGKSSAVCLPGCSYTKSKQTPQALFKAQTGQQHNIFNAPLPSSETILPTAPSAKIAPPSKDYQCASQCMQSGIQYETCNLMCTKPVCPAGKVLCTSPTTTSASSRTTLISPGPK